MGRAGNSFKDKIAKEEILSESDAEDLGLVPLTIWLQSDDFDYVKSEKERVDDIKGRTAKIVRKGALYAVFVNPVEDWS